MQTAGGRVRSAGVTKAAVEKLGPGHPAELWCLFWGLSNRDGEHFIWAGRTDKQGRPSFVPNKGPPLLASHVAWAYHFGELPAGESLQPTCRRKLCIRPEHQEVVRGLR